MKILILNAGSSSLKVQIFGYIKNQLKSLAKAEVQAINLSNCHLITNINHQETEVPVTAKNHQEALKLCLSILQKKDVFQSLSEIKLIGHRVVHGGEQYQNSVKITPAVIKGIKQLCQLAPLHNPANLAGILACQKLFPKVNQFAKFDTAFHQTMPPLAYRYAIPTQLYQKFGLRKYGFHGINHKFSSIQAIKILKKAKLPAQKLITCHLGNGCSVSAIKNGKSIENSMGFTPLEGLVMGTRSGDLDPAIPLELCQILKKTPAEVETFLNKESGLKGLTDLSSDVRTIRAAALKGNKSAQFALDLFAYRLGKYINSYIGILGGIDAIVFTGGIGEHAWYIRSKVISYLKHLGFQVDGQKNRQNSTRFEKTGTKPLLIIPANEELAIAQTALQLSKTK